MTLLTSGQRVGLFILPLDPILASIYPGGVEFLPVKACCQELTHLEARAALVAGMRTPGGYQRFIWKLGRFSLGLSEHFGLDFNGVELVIRSDTRLPQEINFRK